MPPDADDEPGAAGAAEGPGAAEPGPAGRTAEEERKVADAAARERALADIRAALSGPARGGGGGAEAVSGGGGGRVPAWRPGLASTNGAPFITTHGLDGLGRLTD